MAGVTVSVTVPPWARSGAARDIPGWACLAPLAAGFAVLPPPTMDWQVGLAVPAIAVFGVPHGATDWNLARLLFQPRFGRAWMLIFAAWYGVLMAAVVAAAAAAPPLAMLAFLAVAVWHFGAEDAGAIGLAANPSAILACGAPPVLAGALFWPAAYAAVLHSLGVLGASAAQDVFRAALVAMGAWACAAGLAVARNPARRWRLALELGAVLALQAAAPPVLAFTLYFCLVHAPRHMRALPPAARGWQMAPVSALAIALLAGGTWIAARGQGIDPSAASLSAAGLSWAGLTGIFWGLAALTLPHVALGRLASRWMPAPPVPTSTGGTPPGESIPPQGSGAAAPGRSMRNG